MCAKDESQPKLYLEPTTTNTDIAETHTAREIISNSMEIQDT